jgi:hypothetical protein
MRVAIVFFCAAVTFGTFPSTSVAQASPTPAKILSADTADESPLYPVGDATPVYRAVLDLIYLDGSKRPPVVIMLDSAEGGYTGGPCPVAKCIENSWTHKSKMDTSTVLAFARMSRKRPRLVQFGYPIPIVYLSYDDVNRMSADGREYIASHPIPSDLPVQRWGFWTELNRKYPDAWGVTFLSKVGFNERHTEALVQAHQWCGDDCRVHETLFLRQTKGRWRVVERIPEQVERGFSPFGRYVGPAGATPKESEIVPVDRPGVPTEATARDDVYRTVLDSLYSVNGERPKRIVLTNRVYLPPQLNAHTSTMDSALVKKFSFLATMRAPFDAISGYRVPIATLPIDSIPALRGHGLDMDQTSSFFWPAFAARYPGAWGMLGVGRIAFNSTRSRALVSTSHVCGYFCRNLDTWFLTRSGKSWRIAERIPGEKEPTMDVEGLRYLGADVSPVAYRPHRVQGIVSDEATRKPIPFLDLIFRRTLVTSGKSTNASVRTDKTGHYAFADLPLNAMMTLIVPCPGQQRAAQVQPIAVTPGMDTTVNTTVDFTVCDTTAVVQAPPAPPAPNPLSGAQAFIGSDSARFEFPRQSNATYEWDVPMKGAGPGSAEYMWDLHWEIPDSLTGDVPYLLWLIKRWNPGGPRKGSLKQLIAGARLEPMIVCRTCDGPAVFEDPDTDHSKVFATVENDRLVFVVRGAEAVRRIFPQTPTMVIFTQSVRHTPLPQYGPGEVSSSQQVLVNCRNSNESADAKHRCDVKQ